MSDQTISISTFGCLLAGISIFGCNQKADRAAEGNNPRVAGPSAVLVATAAPVSFNEQIRPILSDKCFACHGFDEETREEDLRLDTRKGAIEDLGGYAALVPGSREKSEMWVRMVDSDDPMPPEKSHKTLSEEEIELVGRWIDEGAAYEEHWAYTAVERPEIPTVSDPSWSANPLDRFVLAKLENENLKPSPRADKRTLMRRVTFDLTDRCGKVFPKCRMHAPA